MRNPKEDRRVRRTQKLLKESLVQLMSEKAFKDITIKDITERADLNRGTFYLHYSDTYDLLTAMENGVLEDFQEMITAYMPSRPGNGLMPVLLPIVHYIVENEQICKNLFENNVSNEFVTKFKELIRKNGGALIERLYPACQTADSEYFFEFITYGLIGIIKKWLDNGMPQTEEEIARMSSDAVLSLARSFLRHDLSGPLRVLCIPSFWPPRALPGVSGFFWKFPRDFFIFLLIFLLVYIIINI